MSSSPLFPLPEGLCMTDVRERADEVVVGVTSQRESSPCPQCSVLSSAIHSFYRRHPQDLPCVGRPIRLILTVRSSFVAILNVTGKCSRSDSQISLKFLLA